MKKTKPRRPRKLIKPKKLQFMAWDEIKTCAWVSFEWESVVVEHWNMDAKRARKLAAWLLKAADYLEHQSKRGKGK